MAVPWFYTSLDVCNSNSNNKLVIVPPSSSVPLDEASPYYGCRNVAFWLADEKKFLVHTGDKLAINKAFLTVFQNSSKNQWEQVLLMGGRVYRYWAHAQIPYEARSSPTARVSG